LAKHLGSLLPAIGAKRLGLAKRVKLVNRQAIAFELVAGVAEISAGKESEAGSLETIRELGELPAHRFESLEGFGQVDWLNGGGVFRHCSILSKVLNTGLVAFVLCGISASGPFTFQSSATPADKRILPKCLQ
jgi:hypothetical protein